MVSLERVGRVHGEVSLDVDLKEIEMLTVGLSGDKGFRQKF